MPPEVIRDQRDERSEEEETCADHYEPQLIGADPEGVYSFSPEILAHIIGGLYVSKSWVGSSNTPGLIPAKRRNSLLLFD